MVRKVTIMPNNWEGVMPLLIMILRTGKEPGQNFAEEELMRLARATDRNNEDFEGDDDDE